MNIPLYARSFCGGIARLFDFGGYVSDYNYLLSDREIDSRAIQSDWQFVGQDIWGAIRLFEEAYLENGDSRDVAGGG